MQSRIILPPIVAEDVHIDTVNLSHAYHASDLPPPLILKQLNFDLNLKQRGNNEITTAYYRSFNNEPRLNIIRSEDKSKYSGINVEISLSKLNNETGLGKQVDEDIDCALDALEDFIRQRVGVEFNARTAKVRRFDVNADFRVGEERIALYEKAALKPYSRLTPSTFGSTTRYFYNDSKTFAIYGKYEEMKKQYSKGKFSVETVNSAKGLLRIEMRLKTIQAIKRFAGKSNLSNEASQLLKKSVASNLITETVSDLGLNKSKFSLNARTELLIDHFGKDAAEMLGILLYKEEFGDEFWKKLGWSPATYYRKKKELESVNLWNVSPAEALPALAIP